MEILVETSPPPACAPHTRDESRTPGEGQGVGAIPRLAAPFRVVRTLSEIRRSRARCAG